MNEEFNDELIDLLTARASYGIDADEQAELEKLIAETGFEDDGTFDRAAAAIALASVPLDEPLPEHLHARILASGNEFVDSLSNAKQPETVAATVPEKEDLQKVFTVEPRRSAWNWLGWAVAAAACVALVFNIWSTRIKGPEVAVQPTPTPTVKTPAMEEEFAAMMASTEPMVKARWTPPAPTAETKDVSGDVVWSDKDQKGFMRLKGLPMNDKSRSTYQLWIFDKTQDKATPIDGGTFDVDRNGEVIVPINAKLHALEPQLFAITVEKPGGVVVSKRDKIAALAKVETQPKSSS